MLKREYYAAWLTLLLLIMPAAGAENLVKLEPLMRLESSGRERLTLQGTLSNRTEKSVVLGTAFVAVVSSDWPEGLVPVFSIEREDGHFELRRLPPIGQEIAAEPLFFGLPREEETNVTRIAGRWNCNAANAQRSNHSPDWQLAIDGERVAGRFDPFGEYRVAYITGGVFQSNRLELNVQYINDHYVLNGEWRDGKLSGTWRHREEPEQGIWEATRARNTPTLPANGVVPLYEWRNAAGQKRYSTDEKLPGWSKETKLICRVWKE